MQSLNKGVQESGAALLERVTRREAFSLNTIFMLALRPAGF